MNFQKILLPVAVALLMYGSYRTFGWSGVALVATGLVTWLLMHFTRMMKVLQRASTHPIGFVDSAGMLNVKLKPGVNLLRVMALTRSAGQPLSPEGADPESFRWTDESGSHVTCTFRAGRLVKWELVRAEEPEQADVPPAP